MVKKRALTSDLFEDDAWVTDPGDETAPLGADPVEDLSRLLVRKCARQRLEEYFELKRLRQVLDEELTRDVFDN